MAIKVAINGFGRIGRLTFRILTDDPHFEVLAINDLGNASDLAYLLKYDSIHGRFKQNSIISTADNIIVDDKKISVFCEKDPTKLPWQELGIDLVFECSGALATKEKASGHLKAGAKRVIVSAPAGDDVKTIVYNVNHQLLTNEEGVISTASCTTNCLAPVLKVLDDAFGVENGFMTTVHAYTNDQATLDIAHPKGIYSRRGRSAASNLVPTSTGAAKAIGLVMPNLEGKLDGISLRVPVADGSIIDLVLELKTKVDKEMINRAFRDNANETILFTEDPIVSSDVIGTHYGALVDGLSTKVLETEGSRLVKVLAWYDNEMGYCAQMVRVAKYLFNL